MPWLWKPFKHTDRHDNKEKTTVYLLGSCIDLLTCHVLRHSEVSMKIAFFFFFSAAALSQVSYCTAWAVTLLRPLIIILFLFMHIFPQIWSSQAFSFCRWSCFICLVCHDALFFLFHKPCEKCPLLCHLQFRYVPLLFVLSLVCISVLSFYWFDFTIGGCVCFCFLASLG